MSDGNTTERGVSGGVVVESEPVVDSSSGVVDRESELIEKYKPNGVNLFFEWRKCMSAYNQFHQVYIYGEFNPCTMERKRLFACMKWRSSYGEKREKAVEELLNSFESEQKNMVNPNTPWTLREDPAADWKKP